MQLLQSRLMRSTVTDIFNEINAPKRIQDQECLQTIADALKYVLSCKLLVILIKPCRDSA